MIFNPATSDQSDAAGRVLPVLPDIRLSIAPIPTLPVQIRSPNLKVQSAVLVDGASGALLYAERPEQAMPIASTTKLVTALVVRQKLELGQEIEITSNHTSIIGSDMGLRPGEKISVRNLLAGLLITSGNDAAAALAETASGSAAAFVAAMNIFVAELGLDNTEFFDPAGLDDQGHSTAFEMSMIARAALLDPVISDLTRTAETTVWSTNRLIRHDLKNSNRLITDYSYLGALGLKTGFTPAAGHCLVAAAERDGHRLIAVILHTDDNTITASAEQARLLLDWGWANLTWP